MDGIRVKSGIKRIEVNDDGEYIELHLGDSSFPVRYFEMTDRVTEKINEMQPRALELDQKYRDAPNAERQRAMCAFSLELHAMIRDEVDGFFGEGTCRKVFGDIVPTLEMYSDFFEQLKPFFSAYAAERAALMSRYSPERMGNV